MIFITLGFLSSDLGAMHHTGVCVCVRVCVETLAQSCTGIIAKRDEEKKA